MRNVNSSGALDDSNAYNGDRGVESYSLLNFRAAYTLGSKVPVTLSVKLDNITNKHYQIIYGCPMPGTTILGGVEFKF